MKNSPVNTHKPGKNPHGSFHINQYKKLQAADF